MIDENNEYGTEYISIFYVFIYIFTFQFQFLLFITLFIFSFIYFLNIQIFIYFYIYMYMYLACNMISKHAFAYINEMNEFHDRRTSNSKGNY